MTGLPLDPDVEEPSRPLHWRAGSWGLVATGALVGTYARYVLEEAVPHPAGGWPWATFLINLCGAFILGLLLESLSRLGPDDGWRRRVRLCVGTGTCGAFTTYSTFALEGVELIRDDHVAVAIAYFAASVISGVVCAWLGIVVGSMLLRSPGVAG